MLAVTLILLFTNSVAAPNKYNTDDGCPITPAVTSNKFCSGFKKVVTCECDKMAPFNIHYFCRSMSVIKNNMDRYYGGVAKSCKQQKKAPYQDCMDHWNCYLHGGRDSKGHLCNSSGKSCLMISAAKKAQANG